MGNGFEEVMLFSRGPELPGKESCNGDNGGIENNDVVRDRVNVLL